MQSLPLSMEEWDLIVGLARRVAYRSHQHALLISFWRVHRQDKSGSSIYFKIQLHNSEVQLGDDRHRHLSIRRARPHINKALQNLLHLHLRLSSLLSHNGTRTSLASVSPAYQAIGNSPPRTGGVEDSRTRVRSLQNYASC